MSIIPLFPEPIPCELTLVYDTKSNLGLFVDNLRSLSTQDSLFLAYNINLGPLSVMEPARVPQSPIPHLLRTNLIPTPLEVELGGEAIAAARKDLKYVDEEIERIEFTHRRLRERKHVLQTFLDNHIALCASSTSLRLLPEILSEIFLLVHYSPKLDHDQESTHWTTVPLRLSQVCRHWREVALATSRLWDSVSFLIQESRRETQYGLLDLWLTRSRSRLLHVSISDNPDLTTHLPLEPLDVTAMRLLSNSYRWRSLNLSIFPFVGSWQRFSSIKNNIPTLQECNLEFIRPSYGDTHAPADQTPMDLFQTAPQLEIVLMDRAHLFTSLAAPFEQFTFVDLSTSLSSALSLSGCLQILIQCPNMRTCNLKCGFLREILAQEPVDLIVRPHLQELTLTTFPSDLFVMRGMSTFFARLSLPSLCSLKVVASPGISELGDIEFIDFLKRIRALEKLDIVAPGVSGITAAQYLRASPQIQTLHLRLNTELAQDVVRQLDVLGSDIWSSLASLRYDINEEKKSFTIGTDPIISYAHPAGKTIERRQVPVEPPTSPKSRFRHSEYTLWNNRSLNHIQRMAADL